MIGLSLSPRYDLFRFILPKDFLSDNLQEKYTKILSQDASVLVSPIDYLNESIQGVHIPGISDLMTEQVQHETNSIVRKGSEKGLGRINVEPQHTVVYSTASNPHEKIEREFKVTFRMNQGLYNYYMLYESIFEQLDKDINKGPTKVLYIEILDESGKICGKILFNDCYIDGIDGLDFSYDKTTRDTSTFDITFKYNKIDFEFVP